MSMDSKQIKIITAVFASLFLIFSNWVSAQDPNYETIIRNFVECVKRGDKQELSKLIRYPLSREYPLPSIKTPKEFLLRFSDVFDDILIEKIVKSNPNEDWSEMGWRGIMLENGIVWLDYDGKVSYINYESKIEIQKRTEMINAERKRLYSGLRNYLEPVLEWKTKNYRIRIDDLGKNKFRYASWPIYKLTSEKPDIVLDNGECVFDGSGGNHYFEFRSGVYIYRCYVSVVGTSETPPGELEVYKNDILLLNEPVIEVLNQ